MKSHEMASSSYTALETVLTYRLKVAGICTRRSIQLGINSVLRTQRVCLVHTPGKLLWNALPTINPLPQRTHGIAMATPSQSNKKLANESWLFKNLS